MVVVVAVAGVSGKEDVGKDMAQICLTDRNCAREITRFVSGIELERHNGDWQEENKVENFLK